MLNRNSSVVLRAAVLVLALLCAGSIQAGDAHDQDRARQALEAGEILPLRTILEKIERDYPGQVMEVDLERKESRWIYEVKVLRMGGTLIKLKYDARDGALLGAKTREEKDQHRGESR
ncbi:MAG TPA: PepSY domain-containing protein [Gallionella sp.]|jgi:uncharacterized membrane protein YkoI|nr:PepSY domain-containing protein [Gallionella sp.]